MKVSTNGSPLFEFFKKSARKNIFVNFNSNLPKHSKISFIRNEYKRIEKRCTKKETLHQNIQEFDRVLRLNDYPENVITKAKSKQHELRQRKTINMTDFFNFKFPYISDELDQQIKKIFRSENINIRLVRRGNTIRRSIDQMNQEPAR